jgi:hypothetical protein
MRLFTLVFGRHNVLSTEATVSASVEISTSLKMQGL